MHVAAEYENPLPNKIPAFGLSAVPLPMKNRTMLPGCHPPIADAAGDTTADAEAAGPTSDTTGSAGSPLDVVAAAAFAVLEPDPSSRRVTAAAAHANGAAAGAPPSAPPPSQSSKRVDRPDTAPPAAGVADITGADAAAGAVAATTTTPRPDAAGRTSAAPLICGIASRPDDGESSVVSTSASAARGGSDGVETEPSVPGLPADGIEGAGDDFADPKTAERLLRRGVPAGRAESAPPRASESAPAAGISSGAELSEAKLASEAGSEAGESEESSSESAADPPRAPRAPRAVPRVGDEVDAPAVDEDEASDVPDPVDPEDPLVSAKAIGIAEMPEPTPRATANTPTRPTYNDLRPPPLRTRSQDTEDGLTAEDSMHIKILDRTHPIQANASAMEGSRPTMYEPRAYSGRPAATGYRLMPCGHVRLKGRYPAMSDVQHRSRHPRPKGISSRVTRAPGPRHPWSVADVVVDLPVIVDWVSADAAGCEDIRIEATIDLVDAAPQIVEMIFQSPTWLDPTALQRDFRWASPLEVVTGLMPELLAAGLDPFDVDLPLTGFPAVATRTRARQRTLSDEFLTTIAREYTVRGRGYAASLAKEYVVSPRTVVSLIEKARTRGLLTRPATPGAIGGRITHGH